MPAEQLDEIAKLTVYRDQVATEDRARERWERTYGQPYIDAFAEGQKVSDAARTAVGLEPLFGEDVNKKKFDSIPPEYKKVIKLETTADSYGLYDDKLDATLFPPSAHGLKRLPLD